MRERTGRVAGVRWWLWVILVAVGYLVWSGLPPPGPPEYLIPHRVLERESTRAPVDRLALTIEVPLIEDRLPNESELGEVSAYLVGRDRTHDEAFVFFVLPGMNPDKGAVATAHHRPTMEVHLQPWVLMRYPQYARFLP